MELTNAELTCNASIAVCSSALVSISRCHWHPMVLRAAHSRLRACRATGEHLSLRRVEGRAPRRCPDVVLGRAELLVRGQQRRVHNPRPRQALRCAHRWHSGALPSHSRGVQARSGAGRHASAAARSAPASRRMMHVDAADITMSAADEREDMCIALQKASS